LFVAVTALFAVLVTLSSAQAAETAEEAVDPAISALVLDALRRGEGNLPYGPVKPSPIPGLYQVTILNGPTLYVSGDGKFFVAGDMFAIKPGMFVRLVVDVDEKALIADRVESLSAIPAEEMIVFPAEGKRKAYINVFTDVDCGFCRKLHREVPALNARGIEVRYLAYPRAGVGSGSYNKLATAWCSENPEQALTKLKNRESLDTNVCANNPVAKQFELGGRLGVNGTPALVLADGTLIPGYKTADSLAKILGL
jgi:thiol:disulfide interchange protein DsbC